VNLTVPDFDGQALCAQVDPDLWFPNQGESTREAKRICKGYDDVPGCPVINQCLKWALENGETGVWGGTSEFERRRLNGRSRAVWRPISHGSEGGYRAHLRRGEKACESCAAANRAAGIERDARRRARKRGEVA
jgi:WhiB family redox-sensing transcriptional regulator